MTNSDGLIRPQWPLPAGVGAVITSRWPGGSQPPFDGNNLALHVGDDPRAVRHNRQRLLRQLPAVRALQWLNQTHSNRVVPAYGGTVLADADACVSREPGLACCVLTADCLPLLIAAHDGSQVAAVHAGWRGLANGIIERSLQHFPGPVTVYLGPAIGAAHFEVGPELRDIFCWASDACFVAGNGDRLLADIYQLAREALAAAGVSDIYGGGFCTVSEVQRFYSYRHACRQGNGQTGRMASLIWIEK